MKRFFKQNMFIVGLIVGLSSTTVQAMQPDRTTRSERVKFFAVNKPRTTPDFIELITAILRLPGSMLEYKLRNDNSFKATITKMAINAIRLTNDLCAITFDKTHLWPTPKVQFLGVACDLTQIAQLLKKVITDKQKAASCTTSTINNDQAHEKLRQYILPFIESFCAVARWRGVRLSPNTKQFSRIGVTFAQLGELYLSAAEDSIERKAIGTLLIACIVELLYNIKMKNLDRDQRNPRWQTPPPDYLIAI